MGNLPSFLTENGWFIPGILKGNTLQKVTKLFFFETCGIFDLYSMPPCTNGGRCPSRAAVDLCRPQAQARARPATEHLPKEPVPSWDFWEEPVFVWWHSCSTSQVAGGLFGNAPAWTTGAAPLLCHTHPRWGRHVPVLTWVSSKCPSF